MKLEGYSKYEIYPETGQIWSYKSNRFLQYKPATKGYVRVQLSDDNDVFRTFALHRVIWITVNGQIPKGMQVNHIDENKENNSISNLNLMSCKENVNWGTGKQRSAKARINHPKRSKSVVALHNGKIIMCFPSMMEAERKGYMNSYVCKCCKGVFETAYGYKWQYVEDYLADWWDKEMDKYMEKEKAS